MKPARYLDTPSIASCSGCPLWICFDTAGRTNMQSSCTAIWLHSGLLYGLSVQIPAFLHSRSSFWPDPSRYLPGLGPLRDSFQTVLRDCLMSPFLTVFTVQFHSSNCDNFGVVAPLHKLLALPRWPKLSWEWTSLRSDSLGSDLQLIVGRFSPVAASSFRVLFGGVLSASSINCQKESSRLSVSFCWSSNNCHFSRDDWRVSLSELLRFFLGPNCLSCSLYRLCDLFILHLLRYIVRIV